MQAVAHKVFYTCELLEMILLALPLPCVLRLQRVNTAFRDIVRSSKQLQRHLFYTNVDNTTRSTQDGQIRLNPLLNCMAPLSVEPYDIFKLCIRGFRQCGPFDPVPSERDLCLEFEVHIGDHVANHGVNSKLADGWRERGGGREGHIASWRQMLVCQNNSSLVTVKLRIPMSGTFEDKLDPDTTLGTLYDLLMRTTTARTGF